MVRNTKQNWQPGSTVKVGFLTLEVVKAKPTPGDYLPDAYLLKNSKGDHYEFVPHNGLSRLPSGEHLSW